MFSECCQVINSNILLSGNTVSDSHAEQKSCSCLVLTVEEAPANILCVRTYYRPALILGFYSHCSSGLFCFFLLSLQFANFKTEYIQSCKHICLEL